MSGLDFVFSHVESAIILEDDILPHASFFPFAAEMLHRYGDDRRVMAVCGTNVLGSWHPRRHSYFFSRLGSVWGWATWRRAWELYDREMALWHDPWVRETVRGSCGRPFVTKESVYARTCAGEIDTWDCQWELTRLVHGGLSVVPSTNLVTNIGFGDGATHTHDPRSPFSSMSVYPMQFPVRPPVAFLPDLEFDTKCLQEEGWS